MSSKYLLLSLLVSTALAGFGQQEVVDVLTYRYQDERVSSKTLDTLELPFRDDFSDESTVPNTLRWSDSKAYINNTFSTNQWSRGYATFDGLDEGGKAYDFSTNTSDTLTDVLTSCYLNLSTATSPFLTFTFQEGGLGDFPESDDSLIVDFWNVDSARWERVWSIAGGRSEPTEWNWASVPATDAKWLKDGFRFRLGIYGAPNGGFDVWNVDYLSVEDGRTIQDTIVSDPAITQQHPFLINNFTQVPWFHMSAASYRNTMEMKYQRNGPVPIGGWSLNLGKYRLFQDGTEIDSRTSVPVVTVLTHDIELDYSVPMNTSTINTSPGAPTDVNVLAWYDGEAVGVRKNDTILHRQRFDNVYAYDDGSAERVYGLTESDAYILVRFQPLVSDTLKGVQIYFGQAKNDITNTPFKIVIYSFQNNAPGQQIYLSDKDYYPIYAGRNNQFATYELDTSGIYINGTVFIGVQQLTSTPLTIGLDRRQDSLTQIVYGDGVIWYPSLQMPSSLMMRPYFRYAPNDISVMEPVEASSMSVFPNPSKGNFIVRWDGEVQAPAQLLDMNGRVIWKGEVKNNERVQTGYLPAGMYFLQLQLSHSTAVRKILIQ